ncbi:MAG: formate dehydrogenase subunit alpha [Gammaproteobacteria bacterium]
MKKVLTTCPYCGTGCNFYLLVNDNEELVGVEPSANTPVSKGGLCIKGWNSFQFVNHPERLTEPLIRKAGKLVESSWEDALSLIVEKLLGIQSKYGNDALMFLSSARATNEENYLLMKLARGVFHTNNIDHCARLCHASTVTGLAESFGSGAMSNSISCFEKSDCFFVIGSNTTEQHPLIGTRIIKSKQSGAKLIVADNRTIRLARMADLHIRHKNGTDIALLNGIMHVIIQEKLANEDFISKRTENYDAMRDVVLRYPPERVAAICEISVNEIILAARIFAEAKNAMLVYSMGITQHAHGVGNVKSCANLALLTGQIGRVGTGVNPLRGQNNVQGACDMGALPNFYTGYQKVIDSNIRDRFAKAWNVDNNSLSDKVGFSVTKAMDKALDGTLKAFYIMGENPVMSDANQEHVKKALENLDFVVVQDIFYTPTCEYADVILPAVSFAEKDGTFTSTERRVQLVRKAIEPIGEARADWQIICDLAKRLGSAEFNYSKPAEIMKELASLTPIYGGISYDRLGFTGLQWPCLDINHPGTPILHTEKFSRGLGKFSPVEHMGAVEPPDAEYPFVLSTGRCYFHYHTGTMTRRTRLLDREERFPYVEINPIDAKKLNIKDRDFVMLKTRRGMIKVMARVTDVIPVQVLFAPFHFVEGAANALTINTCDPEAEIPEFKVCAANLWRAE